MQASLDANLKFLFKVEAIRSSGLKEEISDIFELLSSLDKDKIRVFIHGSWADNTRTAFPNLDDFIIV